MFFAFLFGFRLKSLYCSCGTRSPLCKTSRSCSRHSLPSALKRSLVCVRAFCVSQVHMHHAKQPLIPGTHIHKHTHTHVHTHVHTHTHTHTLSLSLSLSRSLCGCCTDDLFQRGAKSKDERIKTLESRLEKLNDENDQLKTVCGLGIAVVPMHTTEAREGGEGETERQRCRQGDRGGDREHLRLCVLLSSFALCRKHNTTTAYSSSLGPLARSPAHGHPAVQPPQPAGDAPLPCPRPNSRCRGVWRCKERIRDFNWLTACATSTIIVIVNRVEAARA